MKKFIYLVSSFYNFLIKVYSQANSSTNSEILAILKNGVWFISEERKMKSRFFNRQLQTAALRLLGSILDYFSLSKNLCNFKLLKITMFISVFFFSSIVYSQTILHYGLYTGILEGVGKDLVQRSDNPGHYNPGFFVRWSTLQNDKIVLEGGLTRMTFAKTKARSMYPRYVEMEGTMLGVLYKLRSYRNLTLYGTAGPSFLITHYYEERSGSSYGIGGEGTKIGAYVGSSLVSTLWKNKSNSLALELDNSVKYMVMDGFNKQALSVSVGLLLAMQINGFH